jgi:hypothetical protein
MPQRQEGLGSRAAQAAAKRLTKSWMSTSVIIVSFWMSET